MSNQYNDYVREVQLQLEEKRRDEVRSSASSILAQLTSLAESNKENLDLFKGVDSELSSEVEQASGDFSKLNGLLKLATEGTNALPALKSSINSLLSLSITNSKPSFQTKANAIVNEAYSTMEIARIRTTEESIHSFIEEMKRITADEQRAKDARQKKILSYVLKAGGILIGLYLIIIFVIPFLIEWWWVLLLGAIGIGWLISKFSS